MKNAPLKKILALSLLGLLCASPFAPAAETNSVSRPGGFEFNRTISRETLDNYLARSITMEGLELGAQHRHQRLAGNARYPDRYLTGYAVVLRQQSKRRRSHRIRR